MKTLYTGKATASGGRSGNVKTDDGKIDKSLRVPKGLGGEGGDGTNPEQLFGAAYAACYGSALELIAEKEELSDKIRVLTVENEELKLELECIAPDTESEGDSIRASEDSIRSSEESVHQSDIDAIEEDKHSDSQATWKPSQNTQNSSESF